MLFSGIDAGNDVETAALVDLLEGRCKKKKITRPNTLIAMRAAAIGSQRFVAVVPSDRSLEPNGSVLVRLLCLNFSGNRGLPKSPA